MKKKIIGIFVFMLLIATIFPTMALADVTELKAVNDIIIEKKENSIYNDKNIKGIYNKKPDNVQSIINDEKTKRGEVLDQSQDQTNKWGWWVAPWQWIAQGFKPTLKSLTRVKLWYFRAGNPSDDIQIIVSIRDDLYGTDIVSTSVNAGQITHQGTWIDVDLPDISVIPDQIYYIVCRATGGEPDNVYCWYSNINNPYPYGDAWGSIDQGYTWWLMDNPPEFPQTDCCFKTYGIKKTNLRTTSIFIIGKITNLITIGEVTTCEVLNVRCVQPFSTKILSYETGEKIHISDQHIGILNANLICGFFKINI